MPEELDGASHGWVSVSSGWESQGLITEGPVSFDLV